MKIVVYVANQTISININQCRQTETERRKKPLKVLKINHPTKMEDIRFTRRLLRKKMKEITILAMT